MIQRQILDLEVPQQRNAAEIQEETRRIYYDRILPMLDQAFDRYSRAGVVIRLDRLEIDLGKVSQYRLEEELVEQVRWQIENQIHDQLKGGVLWPDEAEPNEEVTVQEVHLEWVVYFLQTGSLPWHAQLPSLDKLEKEFVESIRQAPDLVRPKLEVLKRPVVRERLVKQFSLSTVIEVLRLIGSSISQELIRVGEELETILSYNSDQILFTAKPKEQLWQVLVEQAIAQKGGTEREQFLQLILDLADAVGIPHFQLLKKIVVYHEGQKGQPSTQLINIALEAIERFEGTGSDNKAEIENPSSVDQNEDLDSQDQAIEEKEPAFPDHSQNEESLEQKADFAETGSEELTEAEIQERLIQQLLNPETPGTDLHQNEEKSRMREVSETKGDYYISNAGIVLIWPFLETFLKELKLVQNNGFQDKGAAERAVLLLQYLVTGEQEHAEYNLVLNKLLCGLPLNFPVSKNGEFTAKELDEARQLLQAVIKNWPALGKTTVEGLQTAFFQREGRISIGEEEPVLKIKREGYDMLLDKLGWSFNLIRLPWMEETLFVEW